MARLPEPGSDAGKWGDILNEYLSETLDTDGTLKANTVSSFQIIDGSLSESLFDTNVSNKLNTTVVSDGAVTSTKIASSAVTVDKIGTTAAPTSGQVLSYNGSSLAWTAPSVGVAADATSTTKGSVQLAGDLAGTATAPTVPSLANKADKATTYTKTEVDTALSNKANTSALAAKADQSTTYTKTEVDTALSGKANNSALASYIPLAQKGAANGVASLDANGKVPVAQLPSGGTATASTYFVLTRPGVLNVSTGTTRLVLPKAATIVSVVAAVGAKGLDAAIIVDINKNGTTIFTNQANRPTIASDTYQSSIGTLSMPMLPGDYLTVDVDQIGSTLSGSDLTVTIEAIS